MVKVLIIGAGPVGLFLACQLDKSITVDIWEKRSQYKREQIIILNHRNISRLPLKVRRQMFGKDGKGCYVQPPPLDQSGTCYTTKGKHYLGSIVISYMEEVLREYVETLANVNIHYTTATLDSLSAVVSDYDYIIGTDGKSSIVRQWMGGKVTTHTTGYGLVLLFDSPRPALTRPDKAVLGIQAGATALVPQHRFRAFRSHGLNYYIAIQLMKKEYDTIDDDAKTMKHLSPALQGLARQAAAFYGMKLPRDKGNVRLSHFPIELSISDFITRKVKRGARVVAIGDAFMGVNFFSGLGVNYGMDQAVTLADIIVDSNNIRSLIREMKGYVKSRLDVLGSLDIPQKKNDSFLNKCIYNSRNKKQIMRIGKEMGTDLRMLNKTNQCLVINNAHALLYPPHPRIPRRAIRRIHKIRKSL